MQTPFFSLHCLPLLIHLKCQQDAQLPEFLGSAIHGIIGWALLPHQKTYQDLYEVGKQHGKKDIPNPYIIDPPEFRSFYKKGDDLWFQFTLIGNSESYGKSFIDALIEKTIFSFGANRKQFSLQEILNGFTYQPIYQNHMIYFNHLISKDIWKHPQIACSHCSLQLMTPLRIRRNNELVTDLNFHIIIKNIAKRLEELINWYGGMIDMEVLHSFIEQSHKIKTHSNGLYLHEMHRYSSRRKTSMEFNGLLGTMTFQGEIGPFTPLLHAANILHIGRNTTLGCGKICCVAQ